MVAGMPAPAAGPARAPLPLPAVFEWAAEPHWRRIDFLSDLHLSASHPRTFEAWREHLEATPADAVVMLGDLFEYWVGDDQRTRTFERRCTEVLAASASRRCTAFMPGNRDFLLGEAMRRDGGLRALPDPTVLDAWGQRFLLMHGDALCLDDEPYQRFRAQSRSAPWQRAFAALPLSERLRLAAAHREASDAERPDADFDPRSWADVDPATAVAWMHATGCADLIHGHTHRPGRETLAPGFTRHVLSDWDLDAPPAGQRAEVLVVTRDDVGREPPLGHALPARRPSPGAG